MISLDLNMGYYTIRKNPNAQCICTVITPWGKYKYLYLPIGISCMLDIFQEKMSTLMSGLEFAHMYLDDLLCLTMRDLNNHLDKLWIILSQLCKVGLKCNAKKVPFCQTNIEYLGY